MSKSIRKPMKACKAVLLHLKVNIINCIGMIGRLFGGGGLGI